MLPPPRPGLLALEGLVISKDAHQRLFPSPGDPNWRPPAAPERAPTPSFELPQIASTSNVIARMNQGISFEAARPTFASAGNVGAAPSLRWPTPSESPALLRFNRELMERPPSWNQPHTPPIADLLASQSTWSPSIKASPVVQILPQTIDQIDHENKAKTGLSNALGAAWSDAISPTGVAYQIKNNMWPVAVRLDAQTRGPEAYISWLTTQSRWYSRHGMPGPADVYASGVSLVRELWNYKMV
jgi:hypothetical protein